MADEKKPAPLVADPEKVARAVNGFLTTTGEGTTSAAGHYRNAAHALELLKGRVRELGAAAREERIVAHEKAELAKAQEKVDARAKQTEASS